MAAPFLDDENDCYTQQPLSTSIELIDNVTGKRNLHIASTRSAVTLVQNRIFISKRLHSDWISDVATCLQLANSKLASSTKLEFVVAQMSVMLQFHILS